MSSKNSSQIGAAWMRPPAAAAYVGLSESMLAKMRLRGDGPRYSKAGVRAVVYRQPDLDDWLVERGRRSTSETVSPEGGTS